MPLYSYKCPSCGTVFDRVLPLHRYRDPVRCDCGESVTEKILAAPAVRGDYPGYSCPVSGKWVEGRAAHAENLKRTGCRVLEPGETRASSRSAAAADAALEASIDASVEQFVSTLPSSKREALFSEVSAGADAVVERK